MSRILLLAVLVLSACATAPDVNVSRDAEVDMSEMQTFFIRPNPSRSSHSPESLAMAKREIERAIQDTLVEKGYRRVLSRDQADFEVDYIMYSSERYQQHDAHDRYFFDERVRLLGGDEGTVDPVRVGTLHVHFYHEDEPFLEAIASDVIGPTMAIDKRIRAVVPKLLGEIPRACCE